MNILSKMMRKTFFLAFQRMYAFLRVLKRERYRCVHFSLSTRFFKKIFLNFDYLWATLFFEPEELLNSFFHFQLRDDMKFVGTITADRNISQSWQKYRISDTYRKSNIEFSRNPQKSLRPKNWNLSTRYRLEENVQDRFLI